MCATTGGKFDVDAITGRVAAATPGGAGTTSGALPVNWSADLVGAVMPGADVALAGCATTWVAGLGGVTLVGKAMIAEPAAVAGSSTTTGAGAMAGPATRVVVAVICGAGATIGALEVPKLVLTFLSRTADPGIGRNLRTVALPRSADTMLSSRNWTST